MKSDMILILNNEPSVSIKKQSQQQDLLLFVFVLNSLLLSDIRDCNCQLVTF